MAVVRVIVHGARGKMGQECLRALSRDPKVAVVGGVDVLPNGDALALPNGEKQIPYATSLQELLARCQGDVVVDFSVAEAALAMAKVAIPQGLRPVIGTTGLSSQDLAALDSLSRRHRVGVLVVPNFALGAVVLNYLARQAARFFEYAEIFEAHHEAKIDAPSGTALALARVIAEEKKFTRLLPQKEPLAGTRGGDYNGVSIHSTRMPGRMAHHEVVFGAPGQTLALRHDTLNRECYMPGVLLAVKDVVRREGLVVGLEEVLGLR